MDKIQPLQFTAGTSSPTLLRTGAVRVDNQRVGQWSCPTRSHTAGLPFALVPNCPKADPVGIVVDSLRVAMRLQQMSSGRGPTEGERVKLGERKTLAFC